MAMHSNSNDPDAARHTRCTTVPVPCIVPQPSFKMHDSTAYQAHEQQDLGMPCRQATRENTQITHDVVTQSLQGTGMLPQMAWPVTAGKGTDLTLCFHLAYKLLSFLPGFLLGELLLGWLHPCLPTPSHGCASSHRPYMRSMHKTGAHSPLLAIDNAPINGRHQFRRQRTSFLAALLPLPAHDT